MENGKFRKVKVYRLKEWVKDLLIILNITIIFLGGIVIYYNYYEHKAVACDKYKGHTCSIYEVDNYYRGVK